MLSPLSDDFSNEGDFPDLVYAGIALRADGWAARYGRSVRTNEDALSTMSKRRDDLKRGEAGAHCMIIRLLPERGGVVYKDSQTTVTSRSPAMANVHRWIYQTMSRSILLV
jgi:hypothetical protein